MELHTGGGGGWGKPDERPLEQIADDIREGYITEARALESYPQAAAAAAAAAGSGGR
jgi:N-methylhydantoinase B